MQTDLWDASYKPIRAEDQRATIIRGRSFGMFEIWQVNWFEVYYAPHAIEVQFLPKRAKHARTLHVGGPAEVIAIQGWNLPPIGEVTVRTTSTTATHDGMTITTTEYPPFVVKAGDTIDDRLRRLAEGPLSRHMDAYLAQLPHARVLADFRRFRTQPWSQRHDKKALAFTTKLAN